MNEIQQTAAAVVGAMDAYMMDSPREQRHDGDDELTVRGFYIKQWSPYDHWPKREKKPQLELLI